MDFQISERLYIVCYDQSTGAFGPVQVRVIRKAANGHLVVMDNSSESFKAHISDVYKSIRDAHSASAAFGH